MNRLRLWWMRTAFNLFPCYRRTGARITHIAPDLKEVRVKLPLNWKTRGYWGTTFGGSIYGAVDPVYLVMLARNLGRGYMVWDKSARVQFKKPGRGTLYARFLLSDEELAAIRKDLEAEPKIDRTYLIDLTDGAGAVCATVEKIVNIRRRDAVKTN
jgi:hypothetical protein